MRSLTSFLIFCGVFFSQAGWGREFTVATYNVENLFDADGVAVYEDYQPSTYTPTHLAVKLENITKILSRVNDGQGPDLVVFNEIELDQTPDSSVEDYRAWLATVEEKTVPELLAADPLPEALAGIPSEAWLLKACEDAGLKGYHVAITDEKPGAYNDGRGIAIRNVIFSKFPITSVLSHSTPAARAILEVTVDVDGHPLTVLGNHWKSGAGDLESEKQRHENAKAVRKRLDEIFALDAYADVIVTGDLNSHYNQNRRYREMRKTAINDILGAQGNELALRQVNGPDLYNLWFELPSNQRGSDIYQNEWGTLMHLVLSKGLYDLQGVQYVDNSFAVLKIPGLNADIFGRPIRWSRGSTPGGFSDHFPLLARFRVAGENDNSRWIGLTKPGVMETGSAKPIPVDYSVVDLFATALTFDKLPPGSNARDGSFNGRVFFVDAPATIDDRKVVRVTVGGEEYELFTHNQDLRARIRETAQSKQHIAFYGELGVYRGRWQFVLHGKEWLPSSQAGTPQQKP
ncbi:MAG: endonuclease/exonuclease/phosphatase family protein [Terrimicrobiaceae bacterium]